jgi:hypothetical protein
LTALPRQIVINNFQLELQGIFRHENCTSKTSDFVQLLGNSSIKRGVNKKKNRIKKQLHPDARPQREEKTLMKVTRKAAGSCSFLRPFNQYPISQT